MVAPAQGADLHEERRLKIGFGGRHVFDDGLEKRVHALMRLRVEVADQPPLQAREVKKGEIALRVLGAQLDKQVKRKIEGTVRIGAGPIGLVDDHNRPQAQT